MNKVLVVLQIIALTLVGFMTYRQTQLENLLRAQQQEAAAQQARTERILMEFQEAQVKKLEIPRP